MTDPKPETHAEYEAIDGAAVAAKILRQIPTQSRNRLVAAMKEHSPELALKVQEKMYSIQELSELTPQGTQTLVREVAHKDLVLSLTNAETLVKEKLLSGMSNTKREMVQEDANLIKAVQPEEVKEAQWRLLEKLDELREQGKVKTNGKGVWA